MTPRLILLAGLIAFSPAVAEDLTLFELRTYHAHEGKLEALHTRFRDHTMALFEKHGMTNLIYWEPLENEGDLLIYLLGYPDREARDSSWKAFREDPDWQAAYKKSTMDGKLVKKVDKQFLILTDYSPPLSFPQKSLAGYYEMRHYTTNEGKLPNLDARFRDHTIGLFEKHGITNLPYFHLADEEDGSETVLLYFVSSESKEARDISFEAFGSDPEWQAARDASQVDGRLLIKQGVVATPLKPTTYSPTQ